MSTRCLTYVYTDGFSVPTPVVCLYRHYDGYPSSHGLDLANFLAEVDFNDMECMAASMVAHFKKQPYNYYLYPVVLKQDCWQDYEYHVTAKGVTITTKMQEEVLFLGTWDQLKTFCEKSEQELAHE